MKKIPSLFKRAYDGDRKVYNEVVPGSEWVLQGEGIATRKWDGTACLIANNKLYKRYDAKHGKALPSDFIAAQDYDPITGHMPGWLPILEGRAEDRWHWEAFKNYPPFEDGTYELIGPKINNNRERVSNHMLIKHGNLTFDECPRYFEGIKEFLRDQDIEGIVWHRDNGDMVKIKKKDFDYSEEK